VRKILGPNRETESESETEKNGEDEDKDEVTGRDGLVVDSGAAI